MTANTTMSEPVVLVARLRDDESGARFFFKVDCDLASESGNDSHIRLLCTDGSKIWQNTGGFAATLRCAAGCRNQLLGVLTTSAASRCAAARYEAQGLAHGSPSLLQE